MAQNVNRADAAPGSLELGEVTVFGVPIADPVTLFATQSLLTLIGLAAFFLVIFFLLVAETFPIPPGEIIFLLVYPAVLVASGYAGVRLSSRHFLAVFAILALLPALLFTLPVVFYLLTIPTFTAQDISNTWEGAVLTAGIAIVFWSMVYFAITLFRKFGEGPGVLGSTTQRRGDGDYVFIGLPLVDLTVFWLTQILFTAVFIVFVFASSLAIIGLEYAVSFRASMAYRVAYPGWQTRLIIYNLNQ